MGGHLGPGLKARLSVTFVNEQGLRWGGGHSEGIGAGVAKMVVRPSFLPEHYPLLPRLSTPTSRQHPPHFPLIA